MPQLTITDWSQGITDDYIDGPENAAKEMDNLLINPHGKPVQGPGIDIYNSSAPQIPPGNQRIGSLFYFDSTLFVKSSTKLYYIQDGETSWSTLAGPTGNDAFADSAVGAKATWSVTRGHLLITPGPVSGTTSGCRTVKVYRNGSNNWTLVQAGLPRAEDGTIGAETVTEPASPSASDRNYSYVFYFVFAREYTAKVNGVDVVFKDVGTPTVTQKTFGYKMGPGVGTDVQYELLGGIDYTNAANENYDTANMTVELYRTKADQTEPLFAGSEDLGADFEDNAVDSALGEPLYVGAQFGIYNDPVPRCYFSTQIDGTGWYGAGRDVDSDELQVTRLYQSVVGDFDSVPAGNFVDMEGDVMTALAYAGKNPVVFFRNKTYRIEGRYDVLGGGGLRAILVSNVDGAVSQDVAVTENGIYFASERGFCFTDGYQVTFLTEHLKTSYGLFSSKNLIAACYDSFNSRVYFAVRSSYFGVSSTTNGFYICDTTRSYKGRGGVFTTASGRNDARLRPCSVHYDSANNRVLIGDQQGYVFKFDPTIQTYPDVNTAAAYSTWSKSGILWSLKTTAWSFGFPLLQKWTTKLYLNCNSQNSGTSDLAIDMWEMRDGREGTSQLKTYRETTVDFPGLFHRIVRWFTKNNLRCTYKQVFLRKGNIILAVSDDYALATTSGTLNTALLASGSWPTLGGLNLVGHTFSLDDDGSGNSWVISAQSGNTLTLLDPSNNLPTLSNQRWTITGVPKTQGFELHALGVDYEVIGGQRTAYTTGDDGGNA